MAVRVSQSAGHRRCASHGCPPPRVSGLVESRWRATAPGSARGLARAARSRRSPSLRASRGITISAPMGRTSRSVSTARLAARISSLRRASPRYRWANFASVSPSLIVCLRMAGWKGGTRSRAVAKRSPSPCGGPSGRNRGRYSSGRRGGGTSASFAGSPTVTVAGSRDCSSTSSGSNRAASVLAMALWPGTCSGTPWPAACCGTRALRPLVVCGGAWRNSMAPSTPRAITPSPLVSRVVSLTRLTSLHLASKSWTGDARSNASTRHSHSIDIGCGRRVY